MRLSIYVFYHNKCYTIFGVVVALKKKVMCEVFFKYNTFLSSRYIRCIHYVSFLFNQNPSISFKNTNRFNI